MLTECALMKKLIIGKNNISLLITERGSKMLNCPKCNQELHNNRTEIYKNRYFCKSCSGFLINLALLRKISDAKFVNKLWLKGKDSNEGNIKCPICNCAMKEVKVTGDLILDLCMNCQVVWLDLLEEKQIPIIKDENNISLDKESQIKMAIAISKIETAKLMMKYPKYRFRGRYDLRTPKQRIEEIEILAGLKERKLTKLDNLDRRFFAFLLSILASFFYFFVIRTSNRMRLSQDLGLSVLVALILGIITYIFLRVSDQS